MSALRAPFPWFGGKRRVAAEVWQRFGHVANYVEPFFGSGAVLLGRPGEPGIETVNDLDGFVAHAWRSIKRRPSETAEAADWPVNENDLHARHVWLVGQRASLSARLEGDPEWCDPKIAGWWLWGIACWIGGGWCSGEGPWAVESGVLVKGNAGQGVTRQLPHMGAGQGVTRKLPHMGAWQGVKRQRPHLGNAGQGVKRQLPHMGNAGPGVKRQLPHMDAGRGVRPHMGVNEWFSALSERLARVRVCCGDWSRVCTPAVTWAHGITGVLLDPPYADTAGRDTDLYACDSLSVAHDVRAWAIDAAKRADMRIALCGYDGEHEMPGDWSVHAWKATGGYGSQTDGKNENATRERIWFSPACLSASQGDLFK